MSPQTKLSTLIAGQTDSPKISEARQLLLSGSLKAAQAILISEAKASPEAALMLVQVRAYSGDWSEVRRISGELLHKPFDLCQYRDAQDVMKLFALSATILGDWPEAVEEVESIRLFLENVIDMTGEANSYSESFNRFEGYIRSAGRGRPPFKINSPVSFAAMGEEQYARLKLVASFADLDAASRHDFYLWKALYDEDLEKALKLYEENAAFVRGLNQASLIAQLLMSFGNEADEEKAWQIIRDQLPRWSQQYYFEIAPVDLLWDEKMRPLMSSERCLQLLTAPKAVAPLNSKERELYLYEREKITHICTLARSLTEEAIAHFEQEVKSNPDNLLLHTALIGVYSKFAAAGTAAKLPHVAWFTRRFAADSIIEDVLSYLLLDKESDPQGFEQFKAQWLEIVAANPNNTQVLFNASLLLGVDDTASAEELLQRAQSLEPDNAKLAERLFELNAYQVALSAGDKEDSKDKKIRHAREALTQIAKIEAAATNSGKAIDTEFDKLRHLRRRAWFSLEAGLLDACAKLNDETLSVALAADFGERYQYLHDVLAARLSIAVGEVKKATRLFDGLKEKGLWRHFKADMPHMTLLSELVEAGEKEAALELLLTTRADWPPEQENALERTVKAISEDEKPWVPPVRL